jgi:hypothetical protein
MRRKEMKAFVSTLFLLLSPAVVYPSGTSSHSSQRDETNAGTLEPRKPIQREIAGGQRHSYVINATANQYIEVIVEERGIEVLLTLFAPNGKKLTEVEPPRSRPASMITEMSGVYILEIRAKTKEGTSGKYEVRIAQMREPTERDRNQVSAGGRFSEGEQLLGRGDAESLQDAIKKYEEALSLYRATGDHNGEASALSRLGETYRNTGDLESALDDWVSGGFPGKCGRQPGGDSCLCSQVWCRRVRDRHNDQCRYGDGVSGTQSEYCGSQSIRDSRRCHQQ